MLYFIILKILQSHTKLFWVLINNWACSIWFVIIMEAEIWGLNDWERDWTWRSWGRYSCFIERSIARLILWFLASTISRGRRFRASFMSKSYIGSYRSSYLRPFKYNNHYHSQTIRNPKICIIIQKQKRSEE